MSIFVERFRMRFVFALLLVGLISGCGSFLPSGPAKVFVMKPAAFHCGYSMANETLSTLSSLAELKGTVGQVVTIDRNLEDDASILEEGKGFSPVPLSFSGDAGGFWPQDYDTLAAVTLYNTIEKTHMMFANLDARADLSKVITNFGDTKIVHNARRTFDEEDGEVNDNAEYLSVTTSASPRRVLNFLFSFPTQEITQIPLGINAGIMAHEYTHMVFNHLFWEPGTKEGLQFPGGPDSISGRTMAALDEGLSDYFGFLLTKDAGFFDCSVPNSGRDVSVAKNMIPEVYDSIRTGDENYDSHVGGAIWAAINYEIGKEIGFENHGKTIVALMATLKDCGSIRSSKTLDVTFSKIAQCHAAVGGSYAGQISSAYNRRLGSGQ